MVSGAVFDSLLTPLSRDERTLVVPDQRGTGRSSKPASGYALTDYTADVLALLDQTKLERVSLVAHSMGGQIAQHVAARHPHRVGALVLLNPVPADGFTLPEPAAALFRGSGQNRENQGQILDAACVDLGSQPRAAMLDDAARVCTPCLEQSFDAWTAGAPAELDAIDAPTLVVASDDPFLTGPLLEERVTRRIPNARQVHVSGAGHYPLLERPAATAALIDSFLAEARG